MCTTGMNDTGGKFATDVNDTSGKFCHQWQILPPVSIVLLIPGANLPPVSMIPVAIATGINDTDSKFAACVNDTGGKILKQYQAADSLK
jgi:hypothetical protein